MSSAVFQKPDEILDELGMSSPKDLEIQIIAYHCGALVIYEPLSGCEANIVGHADKAVITVNSESIPTRRRFSAGHELGHWMRDRRQAAFACLQRQIDSEWRAVNPEARANQFASSRCVLPSGSQRDEGSRWKRSKTSPAHSR